MTLAHRHEQVFEDLKDHLSVIGGGYPVAELGAAYEDVEECFRALACCHLLRHADTRMFQNNLVWAAFARRAFLVRCGREQNQSDHRRARSRSDASFAALAAGDLALAIEVGDLSPAACMRDGEYEDDFAYHRLVYLLMKGASSSDLAGAVEAYERLLDGGPGERLAVCTALCASDAVAFQEAFSALLVAHAQLMDQERPGHEATPTFEPLSRLFVEGLALLRLAEQRGLEPSLGDPSSLCPSLAWPDALATRPDDIFAEL